MGEGERPSPSVALLDRRGALLDYNERLTEELRPARRELSLGGDFFGLLAAAAGFEAAARSRDGFGVPRSYRYLRGGEIVEVDESVTAAGKILRIARWGEAAAERPGGPRLELHDAAGLLALRRRAHAELLRAKEAATATTAASAQSRFAATVSHELRTPMQGILGMTSLLLRTPVDATQAAYLSALDKSGRLLLDLINDIVDASKIEEGQLGLRATHVDLIECAESVITLLDPQARERSLDLRLTIDPRVPRAISSDPLRLRQILINLVSNAVKFTPRGGVTLSIRPVGEGSPPARLRFEIADTGIGIPADERAHLFAADDTRGGQTLSLTRSLVEAIGGTIGVESEPGVGSRFWFEIPAPIDEGPPAPEAPPALDLRGLRVLVVEDDDVNQAVIEAFLSGAEAIVTLVGEGRAAIEACARDDFDVVLMDIHLPDMDGFAATRQIRAQRRPGAALPAFIAISADTEQAIEVGAASAAMDACVAKPFTRQRFLEAIARVVAARAEPSRRAT
ncbi:MAG: response regulator [Myxococcales bacterium]|nr:response regulator [Myxococcales bacterium]